MPSMGSHRGPGRPGMNQKLEKGEMSKNWGKLLQFCRPFLPAIIIALLCAVGGTVFTIVGPDYLRKITNLIVEGLMGAIDMKQIEGICILLTCFYGGSALLSYIQGFIMTGLSMKVTYNLRRDVFDKINRLPFKYFDKTSYGRTVKRSY